VPVHAIREHGLAETAARLAAGLAARQTRHGQEQCFRGLARAYFTAEDAPNLNTGMVVFRSIMPPPCVTIQNLF